MPVSFIANDNNFIIDSDTNRFILKDVAIDSDCCCPPSPGTIPGCATITCPSTILVSSTIILTFFDGSQENYTGLVVCSLAPTNLPGAITHYRGQILGTPSGLGVVQVFCQILPNQTPIWVANITTTAGRRRWRGETPSFSDGPCPALGIYPVVFRSVVAAGDLDVIG